jgi:putative transcriptional regulator
MVFFLGGVAPAIAPQAHQVERKRKIDVASIRARVGGTQDSFARMIGIPPATVRNWESYRRAPTGAARVLLDLVASDPETMSGMFRKIAAAKTDCAGGVAA